MQPLRVADIEILTLSLKLLVLNSNYASTLVVQKEAERMGLQQVLWLFGPEHRITEAGTSNIFFLIRNEDGCLELITPPLNGIILPGINRQSILDLARYWVSTL